MKVPIQETYDQLWTEAWGDMQRFGPVHRHQTEQLIRLVKKLHVRTVLDVGCGSGDNLAALSRAIPDLRLAGVDVSREALALASQRVSGAELQQLDVQRESLNERFDLVMAIQVIEHLADDVSALCNMGQMSKKWVVITTMRGRMRQSERSIGHFRNYSDAQLRSKAMSAGLQVTDIFGWGFPFYSPIYRTAVEWLPGGPPQGKMSGNRLFAANFLYRLYSLNIPRRGDVVTMVARPRESSGMGS